MSTTSISFNVPGVDFFTVTRPSVLVGEEGGGNDVKESMKGWWVVAWGLTGPVWGGAGQAHDLLVNKADAIVVGRLQGVQVARFMSRSAQLKQEQSATQSLDERLTPRDVASRAYLEILTDVSAPGGGLGSVWLGFKAEDGSQSSLDVEHAVGQVGIWLLRWLPRYGVHSAAYDPHAFIPLTGISVALASWRRHEVTLTHVAFAWTGKTLVTRPPPKWARPVSASTWSAPVGSMRFVNPVGMGKEGDLLRCGRISPDGPTTMEVIVDGPEEGVPAFLDVTGRLETWTHEKTPEAFSVLTLEVPGWPGVAHVWDHGPLVRRTAILTLPESHLPRHALVAEVRGGSRGEILATAIQPTFEASKRVELKEGNPLK